ncbi:MAG TPA: Glu/Leu/Phe/Val dehydrogenase dimerization domain-containing protein [Candidatus Angelobacter sp.]|nr:Glu/Leu/Phe/Val dehydrogenase dimerization domain-containing protein [Candidatus Angelobacter sp.]
MQIRHLSVPGYESVVSGVDEAAGYHGIVFIHSTALGPAVGGTRLWSYESEQDAITDGLRLSRGMTYKNALAGLPCGGGKSIIIRPEGNFDREKLFRAHGQLVESAAGKYITAEDVGTSPADMEWVHQETNHVAGLQGKSGDPSPKTARGVFRAIQACARHQWGSDDLEGQTVAIQGCGHVGYYLAGELAGVGANLVVADVDQSKVDRVVRAFGAIAIGVEGILAAKADVLAPCALGGIINDETIPHFQAEVIAGGANNQLLEPRHGDAVEQRQILYAPDYAANGGGVINGCCRELLGWDEAATNAKIDAIYDTILNIFKLAERDRVATYQAADRLAEEKLAHAVK